MAQRTVRPPVLSPRMSSSATTQFHACPKPAASPASPNSSLKALCAWTYPCFELPWHGASALLCGSWLGSPAPARMFLPLEGRQWPLFHPSITYVVASPLPAPHPPLSPAVFLCLLQGSREHLYSHIKDNHHSVPPSPHLTADFTLTRVLQVRPPLHRPPWTRTCGALGLFLFFSL